MVKIYTDGSSLGNPGPGGRGAIICGNKQTPLSGGEKYTTNNVMELTAVVKVLEWLCEQYGISCPEENTGMGLFASSNGTDIGKTITDTIQIYTDSTYVQRGVTEWLENRVRRDRRRAKGGQIISNVAVWKRLHALLPYFTTLEWYRVKGHAGHTMNEKVDRLARRAAEKYL